MANKSLERAVNHGGRTVRAFAVGARAGAQMPLAGRSTGSLDVAASRRKVERRAITSLSCRSHLCSPNCLGAGPIAIY